MRYTFTTTDEDEAQMIIAARSIWCQLFEIKYNAFRPFYKGWMFEDDNLTVEQVLEKVESLIDEIVTSIDIPEVS